MSFHFTSKPNKYFSLIGKNYIFTYNKSLTFCYLLQNIFWAQVWLKCPNTLSVSSVILSVISFDLLSLLCVHIGRDLL